MFVYVDWGFVMLVFGKLSELLRDKMLRLILRSAAYLCKNFAYFLQPSTTKPLPIFSSVGVQKRCQFSKALLLWGDRRFHSAGKLCRLFVNKCEGE